MDGSSQQNSSQKKKKGTGRRKIKMQKITNDANLQVTFSKRRAGLFKKASELDTLCGTESAVVAFSPSEKAHSYGNPDVETIAEKYMNSAEGYNHQIQATHHNAVTRQRNQKVTDLERQLELEKKYKKELNRIKQENQTQFGVPPNLDELNYQQLDELRKAVLGFKQEFETTVQHHGGSGGSGGNAYGQGPNPNATMGGGFPVGGGGGVAYTGLPSGSNTQGPGYMGNMYGDKQVGFPNYPTMFNTGAGNVNDTQVLPFPNNAEPGYPNQPIFSDMMNANNGYVNPLDQLNGDFGVIPFENPNDVAGGSNVVDDQEAMDEEETENTTDEAGNVYVPWGAPQGYVPGNNQGFPNNFGGGF